MTSILIAAIYLIIGYNIHKLTTIKRKRAMRAHPSWKVSK